MDTKEPITSNMPEQTNSCQTSTAKFPSEENNEMPRMSLKENGLSNRNDCDISKSAKSNQVFYNSFA